MYLLYLFGAVGLGLAGVCLFDKDTAWRWTAWNYRYQGVKAERTRQWDRGATVQGVVLLVVSLTLFGLGVSLGAPAMSGAYVEGHQLTRGEAEAYHRDPYGFLAVYCSRSPSPCRGH